MSSKPFHRRFDNISFGELEDAAAKIEPDTRGDLILAFVVPAVGKIAVHTRGHLPTISFDTRPLTPHRPLTLRGRMETYIAGSQLEDVVDSIVGLGTGHGRALESGKRATNFVVGLTVGEQNMPNFPLNMQSSPMMGEGTLWHDEYSARQVLRQLPPTVRANNLEALNMANAVWRLSSLL